jgi:hypothetical protein
MAKKSWKSLSRGKKVREIVESGKKVIELGVLERKSGKGLKLIFIDLTTAIFVRYLCFSVGGLHSSCPWK